MYNSDYNKIIYNTVKIIIQLKIDKLNEWIYNSFLYNEPYLRLFSTSFSKFL
jgi:hypothetical protein